MVVVATTKVGIFKQITTVLWSLRENTKLLLLPQRQEFSSKSQHGCGWQSRTVCCCCYHKGRNFQANHNNTSKPHPHQIVVVATTKVGIFKQITTLNLNLPVVLTLLLLPQRQEFSSKSQQWGSVPTLALGCCCYHKGRNFQANHNTRNRYLFQQLVVVATTKVGIFKQITTQVTVTGNLLSLLLLPQRQEFSSKSQPSPPTLQGRACCCCYHKGRNFQANHNDVLEPHKIEPVVVATTKVGIFKQITTVYESFSCARQLLLLPQRQEFSSKSQHDP